MRWMQRTLLACLVATGAGAQQAPAPHADLAVFERLVTQKLSATANADAKTYATLVAPDSVWVDDYGVQENAAQHVATIGHRPVGRSRYTFDDLKIDPKEGFVVVTYRSVEHVAFGPREVDTGYRVVETWVAREGRWLVLSHSEAQVVVAPTPLNVPAETLQDYVGRYEWWPGYVDTITRDGDTLYSQGTGDAERTLNHAATRESFYFTGEPNLVVFARDRSGRVTHYVLHWSDGQTTVARRVP